jgi:ABC-type transporter Mla subunit MlaD
MKWWLRGMMVLVALLVVLWGLGHLQRRDQTRWETSLRAVRRVQAMVRELADSLEQLEYWNGELMQAVARQAHHTTAGVTPPQYILEHVDQALAEQEQVLHRLQVTLRRLHASLAQAQRGFWVHRGYRARSAQALAILWTYHDTLGTLAAPLQEAREAIAPCCSGGGHRSTNR